MDKTHQPFFSVPLNKLEDFLQDSIYFRDTRAHTRSPSLRHGENGNGEERLYVFDKFLMHHDYVIQKSAGERFVEITSLRSAAWRTVSSEPPSTSNSIA